MLIRWGDFDSAFSALEAIRRQMDRWNELESRMFGDLERPGFEDWGEGWPYMSFHDNGNELYLYAEVPGLSEKDINVSINQDVLTVSGERSVIVPEGYRVHRHERSSVKFSRSFSFFNRSASTERRLATGFRTGRYSSQSSRISAGSRRGNHPGTGSPATASIAMLTIHSRRSRSAFRGRSCSAYHCAR